MITIMRNSEFVKMVENLITDNTTEFEIKQIERFFKDLVKKGELVIVEDDAVFELKDGVRELKMS